MSVQFSPPWVGGVGQHEQSDCSSGAVLQQPVRDEESGQRVGVSSRAGRLLSVWISIIKTAAVCFVCSAVAVCFDRFSCSVPRTTHSGQNGEKEKIQKGKGTSY